MAYKGLSSCTRWSLHVDGNINLLATGESITPHVTRGTFAMMAFGRPPPRTACDQVASKVYTLKAFLWVSRHKYYV